MLVEANRNQVRFAFHRRGLLCGVLALFLLAAGCATPIGVVRGTTQQTYYALTVAYENAHIEGVESEKIVRSAHSTQSHPETIEEVRRILREH
jgi:hypothetical protein